jgi:hypothetical protein
MILLEFILPILLIGTLICNLIGLVYLSEEKFGKTTLNDTQKGFVKLTIIIGWIFALLTLIVIFFLIKSYLDSPNIALLLLVFVEIVILGCNIAGLYYLTLQNFTDKKEEEFTNTENTFMKISVVVQILIFLLIILRIFVEVFKGGRTRSKSNRMHLDEQLNQYLDEFNEIHQMIVKEIKHT